MERTVRSRVWLWVLTVVAMGVEPAAGQPLELAAAIVEARTASPTAREAQERVTAAHAMIERATAGRMPNLYLETGYRQTNQPMQVFGVILNTATFGPQLDFNAPGTVDHAYGQLALSVPLYRGGAVQAGQRGARAAAAAAEWQTAAVLDDLSLAVVRAWFAIDHAERVVEALTTSGAALGETLRVARERHARGQMLKNELLNIEVQTAQNAEQLLAARHQVALATKGLMILMGRMPHGNLERAVIGSDLFPLPVARVPRAELAAMRAREEAGDAAVAAARAGNRPQAEVFGAVQYDKSWEREGDGDHWMAGVRVQWTLFDGFRTRADVRSALAHRAAAAAGVAQVELQLELQVEEARLNHELAVQQLAVSERLVEQALESAEISRARFETGDLLSTELIGAETRLVEAQLRRAQALTGERVAAAAWRRAAGLPVMAGMQ
jgi:outer membrane protein